MIVTGASGLLGTEHCHAIADAGGIPIAIDIDSEGLARLSKQLTQRGCKHLKFHSDASDETALKSIKDELEEREIPLWGLVNNVAFNPPPALTVEEVEASRLENTSLGSWEAALHANLTSAFLCSKEFGKMLQWQGRGSIVNVASDLALIAPDHRVYAEVSDSKSFPVKPVAYSVSKTALLGLTRYLATYWSPLPIRANCLIPGPVLSDQGTSLIRNLEYRIPLGRLAQPNEYQGALIFLLSDASRYMTGANLVIDGGRTAW